MCDKILLKYWGKNKKTPITCHFMSKINIAHLTLAEQRAVMVARKVRKNAVPPISNFYVGAATLSRGGKIHAGANIEEAAFNGCVHAEPAAIASANACGDRDILTLAVCADNKNNPEAPIFPCLHCWQFICNFAEMLCHPIKIIMIRPNGDNADIITTDEPAPDFLKYGDIGTGLATWKPAKT